MLVECLQDVSFCNYVSFKLFQTKKLVSLKSGLQSCAGDWLFFTSHSSPVPPIPRHLSVPPMAAVSALMLSSSIPLAWAPSLCIQVPSNHGDLSMLVTSQLMPIQRGNICHHWIRKFCCFFIYGNSLILKVLYKLITLHQSQNAKPGVTVFLFDLHTGFNVFP